MTDDVDMLSVGHFAKDGNVVDGQGKTASGGGVYLGSMAQRRLGVRVAVLTELHPDDSWRLEEMRKVGVRMVATAAPETSGIVNHYDSADTERRICREPVGSAGPFGIEEIPPLKARVYMAEGLALVTYLKTDRAEAELLTGQEDLQEAARCLAPLGPREIVITESSGVTVYADGPFCQAPFTPTVLAGRTARGDTCFSSYVGSRLTASAEEATRLAAAATTPKQERSGPWWGTFQDAEALMARWAS